MAKVNGNNGLELWTDGGIKGLEQGGATQPAGAFRLPPFLLFGTSNVAFDGSDGSKGFQLEDGNHFPGC